MELCWSCSSINRFIAQPRVRTAAGRSPSPQGYAGANEISYAIWGLTSTCTLGPSHVQSIDEEVAGLERKLVEAMKAHGYPVARHQRMCSCSVAHCALHQNTHGLANSIRPSRRQDGVWRHSVQRVSAESSKSFSRGSRSEQARFRVWMPVGPRKSAT